jgi:hypothetical protein
MRPTRRWIGLAAFWVQLAAVACSSSKEKVGTPTDGVRDAAPTTAPTGLSLLWRIVESGPVGSLVDAGKTDPTATRNLPPVSGVRVCIDAHPEIPCATSDDEGAFTLGGLPSQTDLVLTCERDGYVHALRAIETASTDMDNTSSPIVTSKSDAPRPDLGFSFDDSMGAVTFFVLKAEADGGLALPRGVTASLSPGAGKGPFFTRPNDTFDTSATSTIGGLGFFFNLPPGDYELSFDDPDADCAPISYPFGAWGYPTPPTSVRFPVRSGFVTDEVGVLCTDKSKIFSDSGTTD